MDALCELLKDVISIPGIDPLRGANCSVCDKTADNFHVSDKLWEKVGLGDIQVCFKCFRIAAWYVGVRPNPYWEVSLPLTGP